MSPARSRRCIGAVAASGRPFRASIVVVLLCCASQVAVAQEAGPPSGLDRLVAGRVLRATAAEPQPVQGLWVVLHRVGSDWAAPLDSVRSGRDGSYTIRYDARGDENALYFVSADYAGIAYFSSPLRDVVVRGDAAELYVFDTTSAPVPVRVLGMHLIISAPSPDGHREVVEVFELANDTTVTRVSGGDESPTFTSILPAGVERFQAGEGDFSPGALLMRDGRMISLAPIAPGLKQLSFSYVLPSSSFPLRMPLERDTEVMEVLLEEPDASVEGSGMVEVTPVSLEQRTFRRFLGQRVGASVVLTVDAPAFAGRPFAPRTITLITGLVVVAMLVALFAWLFARRQRQLALAPVPPPSPAAGDADTIARAIAELDEGFERARAADPSERAAYRARRAELKQRLGEALARRRGEP